MKILLAVTILSSISFSAQVSSRIPLKIDSTKFPKIEKTFTLPITNVSKFDSSIAKLYKMPVAKPKNPEIYSSLKAPKKAPILHKIPNLLDVAKPPKLSVK
ncbi:hypothetical protein [Chryseobacterium indoltheticum]|uniref:hypothetical protein n=1 Tax=Chryseobacterium indoltheticum TaxID=254 RepID=UPI003F49A2A9